MPFWIIHNQGIFRTSQQVLTFSQLGFFASPFYLRAPQTINFGLSCPQLFKDLQRHLQ
jgi:hypothetical protein